MRDHYDFSKSRPNPYVKRIGVEGRKVILEQFLHSANLVRLDEDVAKVFADEASVNEALRLVMQLRALKTPSKPRRARASTPAAKRPARRPASP